MGANIFNEMEVDAIGEIMNISLGASATTISTLLGAKVNITTPKVSVQNRDAFGFKELEPAVGVEISYVEGLKGNNIMMFSRNDVRIIVSMMMGEEIPEDQFEMDEINASAIREVMNQMMGASATALSEFLGTTVNISTPISYEVPDEESFKSKYFAGMEEKVIVRFTLEIENHLKSEFLNIMSVDLMKRLLMPFAEQLGIEPEAEEEAAGASEESAASEASEAEEKLTEEESGKEPSGQEAESKEAEPAAEESRSELLAAEAASAPERFSGAEETAKSRLLEPQDAAVSSAAVPDSPVQEAPAQQAFYQQSAMQQDYRQSPIPQQADYRQSAVPQPDYRQGAVPPQPMYAQPPMPGADPLTMQLLSQMQQSQTQMLELIRDMQESRSASAQERKPRENSLIRPLNAREFEAEEEGRGENEDNRELLMKVPLEISVEIGRTRKLVKDILEFTQGSLVVLDKMAGEQADLYVNGECIARGDIVVVEDNFGIRITEILKKDINEESL